jgi:hypothetical protein
VTGEAAGLAMGLVMVGSMDQEVFNEVSVYFLNKLNSSKILRIILKAQKCHKKRLN